jgi:DNA-3-methyladenine glycosylase II
MLTPTNIGFRLITSDRDVRDGIEALRATCPHVRRMHDLAGDPPLRRREPGFEGLARIVVSQQVSVASATAIWARFAALVRPMEARVLLALTDDDLRSAGLSRPKVRTLRALSTAMVHDGLKLNQFDDASDEAIRDALTTVSGIGPWTADVFLLSCLGRADAFAAGDLALQEATRLVMGLEVRPTAGELLDIAERWRPWRAVAARLLWSYYKAVKERDGLAS